MTLLKRSNLYRANKTKVRLHANPIVQVYSRVDITLLTLMFLEPCWALEATYYSNS